MGDDDTGINATIEDGSSIGDVIEDLQESVFELARNSDTGPKTFMENVDAFRHAVDWSERWIQALVAFHVFLWILTLSTRKRFGIQTVVFFLICILVFAAERLNAAAHEHWKSFSKQDYFDTHGVFAVTMYAAPLLGLGFFQMVNFLIMSSNLLVEAKVAEIKQSRKKKAQ